MGRGPEHSGEESGAGLTSCRDLERSPPPFSPWENVQEGLENRGYTPGWSCQAEAGDSLPSPSLGRTHWGQLVLSCGETVACGFFFFFS